MARHVVIVGGGVVGLCAAWYCSARGFRVTVLDRDPENCDGCSFGNAGLIVPSHFVPLAAPGMVALGLKWMCSPASPFYIQPRLSWDLITWCWQFTRACSRPHVARSAPLLRDLHLASRACYEQLAEAWSNPFGLSRSGLLMLCKTQRGLDEEAHLAQQAAELGIAGQVLDAAATAQRDPGVRMDVCGAVWYECDCRLTPQSLMAALRTQLNAQGCQFPADAEVVGFSVRNRRIAAVRTRGGDFEPDEVVLAAGAWSPLVARELGLKLPMQPGKGYSLTLPQPPRLPRLPSILVEARVAVTPMGSTLRFGGTMELSGHKARISPVRVRSIARAATRYFPDFRESDFAHVQPWCGLRPCSPDGLPYVGRTQRYENLVIATGHAMLGISLGPITGKLVAEIASGDQPSQDLALLSPDRFSR